MTDTIQRTITQELINRYGALNGDNDTLHYDAAYARAQGFAGTIAHGLMLLGPVAELAASRFGASWFAGGHVSMKWVAPTYAGDAITATIDEAGKIEVYAAPERVVAVGVADSHSGQAGA